MQSTREITYGSTMGSGPQIIFSSAETWGELKAEYPGLAAASTGMSSIIFGSNSKLTASSDRLPEGKFSLYLVPDKNNSGHGNN